MEKVKSIILNHNFGSLLLLKIKKTHVYGNMK